MAHRYQYERTNRKLHNFASFQEVLCLWFEMQANFTIQLHHEVNFPFMMKLIYCYEIGLRHCCSNRISENRWFVKKRSSLVYGSGSSKAGNESTTGFCSGPHKARLTRRRGGGSGSVQTWLGSQVYLLLGPPKSVQSQRGSELREGYSAYDLR